MIKQAFKKGGGQIADCVLGGKKNSFSTLKDNLRIVQKKSD